MTKNEMRKVKKGIELLDLLIKELNESQSLDVVFNRRSTFYHIFYNGEKLDDVFLFLLPVEAIEDVSKVLNAIKSAIGTTNGGKASGIMPYNGAELTGNYQQVAGYLETIKSYLVKALDTNNFSVFYSWQSDLAAQTNRSFIEVALKKAIRTVKKERNLPLELDKDTANRAGSPDIAQTILEKIDDCFVFVADISLVMTNPKNDLSETDYTVEDETLIISSSKEKIPEKSKRSPNPNVMYELGYAAGIHSSSNIVLVFNTAYGEVEELPFDLRGRRIMTYNLPEGASAEERKTAKEELVLDLQRAITTICRNEIA